MTTQENMMTIWEKYNDSARHSAFVCASFRAALCHSARRRRIQKTLSAIPRLFARHSAPLFVILREVAESKTRKMSHV
jgi:hypothetical protein